MEFVIRELADKEFPILSQLYIEITKTDYPEFSPEIVQYFIADAQQQRWLTLPIRSHILARSAPLAEVASLYTL